MHDECIWQVFDRKFLLNLGLLVARIALVAFYDFSLNHRLKRVLQGLFVSDIQSEAVEVFIILVDIAT
jgi:hypothetical protein